MSILIRDVLLDGKKTHIYVEDNLISEVGASVEADEVIEGDGFAALPGFVNTHTHAAMTLLRGYADDMDLHKWLSEHIWPIEAKFREEHVYVGTKLACLEMIKSGTTCFNDMYWHLSGSIKAVEEMGVRGVLSSVFIDMFNPDESEKQRREAEKALRQNNLPDRIQLALGPHAVYTVTKESLEWVAQYSEENDTLVHFHLSETKKEVDDCKSANGKRPVGYLDELGLLNPRLVAAHCIWISPGEAKTLGEAKVKVSHCPTSNMKLSSGAFDYDMMGDAKAAVSLGTDGTASNNNLDMFETMKVAALLQKHVKADPTSLPASKAYEMATVAGAEALRMECGRIGEGYLADIILIDLKKPELTPLHNLISDVVYSANGGCVDTVICDGKTLMRGGKVDGEQELLEDVGRLNRKLMEEK